MKYIRSFFGFWRKFIVGDDARIAAVIMWSLLFIDSLSRNYINAWFVLPVVVIIMLGVLTYGSTLRQPRVRLSPIVKLLLTSTVPMLLVIALPPILSRITSNEWGVEYILLPLAIYVAYSIVLAALMRLGLRSYPALSTFILGLASLYLIVYRQDKINEFSQDLTRQNSLGLAAAITILIAIVIAVLVLEFKFRHKQTIEDTGSSAR